MHALLSFAFLALSLVAVSGTFCRSEDDCAEDRCCIAASTATLETIGLCLRRGRVGSRCNKPDAKLDYYGGKFMSKCPCAEGLECEPRGLKPGVTDPAKIRNAQRCQKPGEATTPKDGKTDEVPNTSGQPDVTDSKITVPEVTVPKVTVPEVTVPEVTVPEVTVPEVTVPEVTVPEVIVPEVTDDDEIPEY